MKIARATSLISALLCFGGLATICYGVTNTVATKAWPTNTRISMSGKLVTTSNATGGDACTTPPTSSSSYLLPCLPRRSWDVQDVQKTLTDLFTRWPAAYKQYAAYFLMMPQKFHMKDYAVSLPGMGSLPDDQPISLSPYNLPNFSNVGITLSKPGAIKTAAPFQSGTGDPNDRIFVSLDGFGAPVPIPTAEIVYADFARGLVTRLFMEAYIGAAKSYQGAGGLGQLKLDFGGATPSAAVFQPYLQSASYRPAQSLQLDIAAIAQSNPDAPAVLLYGWSAGGDLFKSDPAAVGDVWRLLSYRYTPEQIGAMVGFTLNYLAGVVNNDRILAIVNQTSVPNATIDYNTVVSAAAKDPAVRSAKQFVTSFDNILSAEFYAISQNSKLSDKDRIALLTRYSNLIRGYRRGVSSASTDLYNDIADISYGQGYENGFHDGYDAGYAAGWAAGYAAGYSTAWAQASVVISNLDTQIANLQSQLNSANSGGGDGGFWGSLGSIVSTGATIIGGIASLF